MHIPVIAMHIALRRSFSGSREHGSSQAIYKIRMYRTDVKREMGEI